MEAAGLGTFMISACIIGVLLEHPASPIAQAIESPLLRHAFAGIAMGLTAIAIILSPAGQRSGAHLNPAVTLTYYMLGKVRRWDAVFYVLAQFAGGITGVAIAEIIIGLPLRHSAVNYVATIPGMYGWLIAFAAELLISAILMTTILTVSNHKRIARYTPLFAGFLIASFITLESPLSGMSMNPARTLGSAVHANEWTAIWIYFTAPPLGMLLASAAYRFNYGANRIFCGKLYHENHHRCIFRCSYGGLK